MKAKKKKKQPNKNKTKTLILKHRDTITMFEIDETDLKKCRYTHTCILYIFLCVLHVS